ncbi:DUF1775 domain-containing protein [Bacillus sp. EB600]|nr:DUF1775 domain-containing protein [Bacillus sp. EB600]
MTYRYQKRTWPFDCLFHSHQIEETSITFLATGEGILPGQFQQFVFTAKNPDRATKADWDAYQYYKDGSVVEWTGDEGSKSPHSITDIVKGTSTDYHTNMEHIRKKPHSSNRRSK